MLHITPQVIQRACHTERSEGYLPNCCVGAQVSIVQETVIP